MSEEPKVPDAAEKHRARVRESAKRMCKIHRETSKALADGDLPITKLTFEYKGYTGPVEFDGEAESEDKLFHGRVAGIRDVVTFCGSTDEEVKQAFMDSVDDYLEFCAERGKAPETPREDER